jgi:probable phosphoglycerate mutase
MKLWLVRHGATASTLARRYSGHQDPPLAPEGRAQAERLAEVLPRGLTVFTSDLARARETAQLAQGTAGSVTADLRELDFGELDGLTSEECAARFPAAYRDFVAKPWEVAPPGGESFGELERRVLHRVDAIRAETTGDVALFTHMGPIKVILLWALGLPLSSIYKVQIDPASAALVELWDGGATLRALNLQGRAPK